MPPLTSEGSDASCSLKSHLHLLRESPREQDAKEVMTIPIFTMQVLRHAEMLTFEESQRPFPQYGLLAGMVDLLHDELDDKNPSFTEPEQDPRVFFNIAAPSSTFICGSQGSGKSHSLSCLLENCLIPSNANNLHKPLTGLVFHYDTFISDHGGSPCEAAFLSSDPGIKVRVLCSPTNFRTIQRTYHALKVEVEPLRIDQRDLNTKRMLDLMAVSQDDGPMPLYLHTIYRILRQMRIVQQETAGNFDYSTFKKHIDDAALSPTQLGPLHQRLDTLESFMSMPQIEVARKKGKKAPLKGGTDWSPEPGSLTIVDLSCPCVTPESACSLFNIALSIFLEQNTSTGRVIALDEAHKFMNASAEAQTFTNTLLSTIRLQRHLGARVIISTQEPTLSPALLDLSSITIVHRFTSPEWLRSLNRHLAGAAFDSLDHTEDMSRDEAIADSYPSPRGKNNLANKIFQEIVGLNVGEALLFSPSAALSLAGQNTDNQKLRRMGSMYTKIRIRSRLTNDGGKSLMAT